MRSKPNKIWLQPAENPTPFKVKSMRESSIKLYSPNRVLPVVNKSKDLYENIFEKKNN